MKRILFVDDERRRIDPFVAALKNAEHGVWVISSADDAVDRLDEMQSGFVCPLYDLVIQDMMMPMPDCSVAPGIIAGTHSVGAFLISVLRSWNDQIPVIVFTQLSLEEPRGAIESLWECFRNRQKQMGRPFEDVVEVEVRLRLLRDVFRTHVWRKGDHADTQLFVSKVNAILDQGDRRR